MPGPSVTAVERVIDIYEAFQASQRPLSLTDLAEAINIPKSTCHAIVATLTARGYLYSLARPRSLYPTKRMYDVASDILSKDPFIERTTPLLEKLRDKSHETVILGKRQGDSVVYLQVIESAHPIRYSAKPGDIKPLHSSSIGKALLGSLADDELHAWVDDRKLPTVTGTTITDPKALVANIAKSQRAGYFQTRGENVSDVWAVAAHFTVNNETLAIAIAGPRLRHLKPGEMSSYGPGEVNPMLCKYIFKVGEISQRVLGACNCQIPTFLLTRYRFLALFVNPVWTQST